MIRTLHVDIEGGYGGSSRSLFELVRRLDRERFAPLIIHRRMGPVADRYRAIDVETVHIPEIFSCTGRPGASGRIFAANLPGLLHFRRGISRMLDVVNRHEPGIIHLNYEGLFLVARYLSRHLRVPLICHSRTIIPLDMWGRWEVRTLSNAVDYMFFISDREEARFRSLETGKGVPGEVLWNIATPPSREPVVDIPEAVFLGNLDVTKAPDRMVEIAAALEALHAPPLRLVVYGHARSNPAYEQALRQRIEAMGRPDRIRLGGFTPDPDKVLASAFAVIRPSRDNDPYGRDVIEATSAGVPVLATGSYRGVVEPGVTGFLFEDFEATAFARTLIGLLKDTLSWQRMSEAGQRRGREKYSGTIQVSRFQERCALLTGHGTAEGVERVRA